MRARLQAEDLGPIVGYLTARIYEYVSDVEPICKVNLSSYDDLANFAESQQKQLYHASRSVLGSVGNSSDYSSYPLQDLVASHRHMPDGNASVPLTHYGHIDEVINEGLNSGVVMPLAVFKLFYEEALETSIFPGTNTFIEALRDKRFQSLVLRFANTHNGFYASGSTSPHTVGDRQIRQTTFKKFPSHIKILKPGQMQLSSIAKAYLRDSKESVDNCKLMGTTVGCPVRFASFQSLGCFAREFAEVNEVDPEMLRNPGASAIVLGCEYLAKELEKQLAFNEWVQSDA